MGFKIDERYVTNNGSSLTYGLVPWDSDIFGFNVIEVTGINIHDIADFSCLISLLESEVKKIDGRVICVKVPFGMRAALYEFQRTGYLFVEQTLSPFISDIQHVKVDYPAYIRYPLLKADNGRVREIQNIARNAFKFDRFHLDGGFSSEKASERYSFWVKNSFDSGEDVLYLDVGGRAVGFSIVSFAGSAYLSLIGLDESFKGKGLGANLFAATCQYVKSKGVKEFSTRMSLNNIEAINVYISCGFKFRDPFYILHKWIQ